MASRSFRTLIRKPISTLELLHLFRSIPTMSDQATVLMCCAFLDRALERAIMARMTKLTRKYHRELFLSTGPISSLWAKIRVGYALAIFGQNTFAELEKIREIRNVFAHAAHPVKFKTRRIAAQCNSLRLAHMRIPPGLLKLMHEEDAHAEVALTSKDPRNQFIRVFIALWFILDCFDKMPTQRPKRIRDVYCDRYFS